MSNLEELLLIHPRSLSHIWQDMARMMFRHDPCLKTYELCESVKWSVGNLLRAQCVLADCWRKELLERMGE